MPLCDLAHAADVLPGVTLHTDAIHNSTVVKQTESVNVEYDFVGAGLIDEPETAGHFEQLGLAGLLPFEHHGPHGPHPPHGKANVCVRSCTDSR